MDVDFAKDEQLQLLEEELEKVVESENFERASEIRDKLLRLQSSAYVSVLSVNMAYYKALNKASIVDMAGCWLQDSSVTCTHPDIGLVKGYINVLNSYGYTFYKGASYVDVKNIQIVMRGTVGYVTCEEHVMTWNADGSKASNVVTSVIQIYSKKNGHWYICHHSSTPSGVTKK